MVPGSILASTSWSNLLIIGIYPAASARRHVLMFHSYKIISNCPPDQITIEVLPTTNMENMVWLFHTHSKSWRCGIFRLSTKKVPEVVLLLSLNHKIVAPENITILSAYKLKNWADIIIIITTLVQVMTIRQAENISLNGWRDLMLTQCTLQDLKEILGKWFSIWVYWLRYL